jgi:hypothetical protein
MQETKKPPIIERLLFVGAPRWRIIEPGDGDLMLIFKLKPLIAKTE